MKNIFTSIKHKYWMLKYKIRSFAGYCWSGSFFSHSFGTWRFLQEIEKDREYYMNCTSPNFKPFWTRVERDMNHVLYSNGRLTRDDIREILRRHDHVHERAVMECGDEEFIAFYLESKADLERIKEKHEQEVSEENRTHKHRDK